MCRWHIHTIQTCYQCRGRNQRARNEARIDQVDRQQHDAQHGPPPPPPPASTAATPLQPSNTESAISTTDKVLLSSFREKLTEMKMDICRICKEEWFDMEVENGICSRCCSLKKHPQKFHKDNAMDPSDNTPSYLPKLTQMEEILISPVHAMVQLWQVRGGHTKYTGHTRNFFRDTTMFHNKVPLLPSEVDVLVMQRRGLDPQTNHTLFQDFRVSQQRVELWLCYLQRNHPSFKPGPDGSVRVEVDKSRLKQFPADAFVDDQLQSIETFEVSDTDEQGPPEAPNNDQEPTQMTAGCVPNDQSEFELLCCDAQLPLGVNCSASSWNTNQRAHGSSDCNRCFSNPFSNRSSRFSCCSP